MKSIQFKKDSGATANTFDAIIVTESPFKTKAKYSDINQVLRQRTVAEYKQFDISFGYLDDAQQTYLKELKEEDAPQFIYDSTTYDIRIVTMQVRANGGKAVVRKTTKEP